MKVISLQLNTFRIITFLNDKFVEPDEFNLNYSFAIAKIQIHKFRFIDRKSLFRK